MQTTNLILQQSGPLIIQDQPEGPPKLNLMQGNALVLEEAALRIRSSGNIGWSDLIGSPEDSAALVTELDTKADQGQLDAVAGDLDALTTDHEALEAVVATKADGAALAAKADVTALAGKLDGSPDSDWGAGAQKTLKPFTVGDQAGGKGTITMFGWSTALGTGCIEMDLPGYGGGANFGGLIENGRIMLSTYGSVTGWGFQSTPYVGLNPIFHAGNFNPALKADLAGATFTGPVIVPSFKVTSDFIHRSDGNAIIYCPTTDGVSHYSPTNGKHYFLNSVNAAKITFDCNNLLYSFTGQIEVTDAAYGAGWNGSAQVPTKNAVYDEIESVKTTVAGKIAATEKGVANGVATLDATGKIPLAQIPGQLDEVLEFANLAAFPGTGVAGKLYLALDTMISYAWSGSAYAAINGAGGGGSGPANTDGLAEGSLNLYHTPQRVRDTVATGMVETAGTPAAGDTILTILGKIWKGFFTDHKGAGGAVHANAVAGGAAGFMTGADKTKLDGVATGATANDTDANLKNRANHTGTQSLDTTTDSATRLAMTAAERTKLGGVATGATANSTDASLRDRSTHTGSQAISTITSLQSTLDSKASAFTSIISLGANTTIGDTHNGAYVKVPALYQVTLNATPTAGHAFVLVNRHSAAITIVCAGGYYKNGAAATATTNLSLAPGGKLTIFHEGAGVYTIDGTGI